MPRALFTTYPWLGQAGFVSGVAAPELSGIGRIAAIDGGQAMMRMRSTTVEPVSVASRAVIAATGCAVLGRPSWR